MSATSPFVGVRVFSDLRNSVASIDTRDSTVIGMSLPLPNIAAADNTKIPMDEPFRISTDDAETIAMLGPGLARDAIEQFALEGIITDVAFSRVEAKTDLEQQIGKIVGSASQKTGVFALLEAKDELKLEPGLMIAPGYTSQRIGGAANPVAMAIDTCCTRIIDCLGVVDAPATSREAAAEAAEDFATTLNMLMMYPAGRYFIDGQDVVRPLSPSVAAAIVRRDKEVGNPFKAAWNRRLIGLRGPSQRVTATTLAPIAAGKLVQTLAIDGIKAGDTLIATARTALPAGITLAGEVTALSGKATVAFTVAQPLTALLATPVAIELTRIG